MICSRSVSVLVSLGASGAGSNASAIANHEPLSPPVSFPTGPGFEKSYPGVMMCSQLSLSPDVHVYKIGYLRKPPLPCSIHAVDAPVLFVKDQSNNPTFRLIWGPRQRRNCAAGRGRGSTRGRGSARVCDSMWHRLHRISH